MLDKTVPYIELIMTKSDIKTYPRQDLPEGYSFCMYEDGFEDSWAELEFSVEEFNTLDEAKDYFKDVFIPYKDELYKRCIFVKDNRGKIVATTTLWYGDTLGNINERVHWVSVHPDYQGKGISKALLTKTLDLYNELDLKGEIYLTTQTWSYIAINVYLKYGFKPYLGAKPLKWEDDNGEDFLDKTQKGWGIVFGKIKK